MAQADRLPSYVDDVIDVHVETVEEVTTFYADNMGVKGDEISAGERGKIYIDVDTGAQYRWSGSQFVQISASLHYSQMHELRQGISHAQSQSRQASLLLRRVQT